MKNLNTQKLKFSLAINCDTKCIAIFLENLIVRKRLNYSEKKTKTGESLKAYCYWLLARRDYAKNELIERLQRYAADPEEAVALAEEMESRDYVNDGRVAKLLFSSEVSKGRGPRKIAEVFKSKKLDMDHLGDAVAENDWVKVAYELKVRKFGKVVAKDPKEKARQIRFLQYRGFDFDVISKVISINDYEYDL